MFYGARSQKGHGVGNLLKGLWRHATPLLKDAGRQALKTGLTVVTKGILKPKGGKKIKRGAVRTQSAATRRHKRAAPMNQTGADRIRKSRTRKSREVKDIFNK